MTDSWQELEPPITKTCLFGFISGGKGRHYACENRACGCLCHRPDSIYSKSWKTSESSPSATTRDEPASRPADAKGQEPT